MHMQNLGGLKEAANKFKLDLFDGEKVIFATELATFGTGDGQKPGSGQTRPATFTMTDRRIVAENGVGYWEINISDIESCNKRWDRSRTIVAPYFAFSLADEIEYDGGARALRQFHFYFNNHDTSKLEAIIKMACARPAAN